MTQARQVLFVDDEPAILDALRRRLTPTSPDWALHFATCPKAALELFALQPFQVLVSDLSMPRLSGLDLARAVKAEKPATQILLLTGQADLETALAAINEADIFRFYRKPFDSKQVISGIADAFAEYDRLASASLEPSAKPPNAGGGGPGFGEATLNQLCLGVIVVDLSARVIFTNPRGAEIAAAKDGLMIDQDGVLRCGQRSETDRLHAVIKAIFDPSRDSSVEALAAARPSMLRAYSVLVSGLPGNGTPDQGRRQAAIFITDPEQRPEISPLAVARLFELTESEARLATALARGASLAEAADWLGITTETARTYLKQVFGKTGTGRQAELVRLIVTAPTVVSPAAVSPDHSAS